MAIYNIIVIITSLSSHCIDSSFHCLDRLPNIEEWADKGGVEKGKLGWNDGGGFWFWRWMTDGNVEQTDQE